MRLTMKKNTLACAVLMALSAAQTAQADVAQDPQVERIEVKSSYIQGYNAHSASGASKLELSIAEIPQSVSVITDQQLEDFQINDINFALDTATGVNVERIETDRTYYTARGFDITNFQVDGVGLPLASGNNHAGEDTAIYDRIEIIRGANGLMTGVGNPSATVNYLLKRPAAHNELAITGSYGSWDNARVEVDGTQHVGESFAARGVLVAESKDSYLDRYGTDKLVGYLFLQANLSQTTTLSLSHSYTDNQAEGNLWGALPLFYSDGSATDYERSTSTSAQWSNWNIIRQNTVLELNHDFSADWGLRATYSHRTTQEDSDLFYVYGTPDKETELGLMGYASEYKHEDKHDLLDLYVNGEFELFGRQHQVAMGVNYAKLDYRDDSLYDYTNGFPVMPSLREWDGAMEKPNFTDGATGADVTQEQKAAYFSGRFEILNDFHLLAGARYNDWQVEGDSYGKPQGAEDAEFIPYLGGVYRVMPQLSVYASYTETFQSQTEQDINNNTLAPVTGESSEVGVKGELFNGRIIATLAYFDIDQKNLAIPDPATEGLPPGEVRYIGADGIASTGFEFDIAGEVYPGLNVSAGYTDFDIEGDETVKGYTSERLFKFSAVYEVPALDGFAAGLNLRWQDDIYRRQGSVGEGFDNAGETIITTQEAYALIDLMARYRINENLSVSLNAYNVTDEKYLNSLYWAQGYYGAPANYSVTLSFKL